MLVLALVLLLLVLVVAELTPKQGVLIFSSPADFAHPNTTVRNEVEWQVILFDVRTGFSLPVYKYRNAIFARTFHWSPDGHHIAGSPMNIGTVVVDVYRKDLPFIVDKGYVFAWSRKGDRFAIMLSENGNYHAYIGTVDGKELDRLETPLKNSLYPSWSADDRQIAFGDQTTFSIYTVNLHSGEPKQLTTSGSIQDWDQKPVWSPDGKSIAYLHHSVSKTNTLVIIEVENGETLLSYSNPNLRLGRAFWSPDSRYIAFVASNKATNKDDLYILDTSQQGTVRKLIDNVYYVYDVPWEMWSPDGRYIAFSPSTQTSNHQPVPAEELYLVEVATGMITKIADVAAAYPMWQPPHQ
jgi:Tol biopolymer transport system component